MSKKGKFVLKCNVKKLFSRLFINSKKLKFFTRIVFILHGKESNILKIYNND